METEDDHTSEIEKLINKICLGSESFFLIIVILQTVFVIKKAGSFYMLGRLSKFILIINLFFQLVIVALFTSFVISDHENFFDTVMETCSSFCALVIFGMQAIFIFEM